MWPRVFLLALLGAACATHDVDRQSTVTYQTPSGSIFLDTPSAIDADPFVQQFFKDEPCVAENDQFLSIDMNAAELIWNNLGNKGIGTSNCGPQGCLYLPNTAQVTTDNTTSQGPGWRVYVDTMFTITELDKISCWEGDASMDAMIDAFTEYDPFNPANTKKNDDGFLQINLKNGNVLPLNISMLPSCCANDDCSIYLSIDDVSHPPCPPSNVVPLPGTSIWASPGYSPVVGTTTGCNHPDKSTYFFCEHLSSGVARDAGLQFLMGIEFPLTAYDSDQGTSFATEKLCAETPFVNAQMTNATLDDNGIRYSSSNIKPPVRPSMLKYDTVTQEVGDLHQATFEATTLGVGADNPTDPAQLTLSQSLKSVTLRHKVTAENEGHFQLVFQNKQLPGHEGDLIDNGRNIIFGGYSQNLPCKIPCKLAFPENVHKYSAIVYGDASIVAHNMYKPIVIGGTLFDGNPTTTKPIAGTSYVQRVVEPNRFAFHQLKLNTPADDLPWMELEQIALTVISKTTGEYTVLVIDQGSDVVTINTAQVVGAERQKRGLPQGEDNGRSLVVFRGTGDVFLVGTGTTNVEVAGRQFGPTVLAPFAKVVADGSAGYIDGLIIARSLDYSGKNAIQVQFHGDSYKGPLDCELDPVPALAEPKPELVAPAATEPKSIPAAASPLARSLPSTISTLEVEPAVAKVLPSEGKVTAAKAVLETAGFKVPVRASLEEIATTAIRESESKIVAMPMIKSETSFGAGPMIAVFGSILVVGAVSWRRMICGKQNYPHLSVPTDAEAADTDLVLWGSQDVPTLR